MHKHANRGADAVLKDRESVWLAHEEDELITECARLLLEPTLTEQLGTTGAAAVANKFSYSSFESEVHRSVLDVLEQRSNSG
jgi:hypothetical protein